LNLPTGYPGANTPLKAFAHNLRLAHGERAREMKHAANELEKLATDMLTYRGIPDDKCLMR
jgi:hypothetical protein